MAEKDSSNPWLSIPAGDYEAHMASPSVRQLQFLNRVFLEVLTEHSPRSIAVVGCATGNGFEHLARIQAERVVALDINAAYLGLLRNRFAGSVRGLGVVRADAASCEFRPRSFDLVHGALVLEYVDPAIVVEKISRWLRPGGVFTVVLQLPVRGHAVVSETEFASLKRLEGFMTLVDPGDLRSLAARRGMPEVTSREETLESGKSFFVGCYRR